MIPGVYRTYYGGKNGSGVFQQIINCIRPHDIYLELFLGNGSVFRHKKPAQQNIVCDLSKTVYQNWLAANIDKTNLYNCDAITFLLTYEFDPSKKYCIYLDPPYPIHSRKEKREHYECELEDWQHEALLMIIQKLPKNVDVIISTYENEIYGYYLKDWNLIKYSARTRTYTATEFLYMNYKPDGKLHQYDFLGNDFTDRQRIKRKIEREVLKLQKLPDTERNAIIEAVLKLQSNGTV